MIKHWEIFCDFDGTITYNDVGDVTVKKSIPLFPNWLNIVDPAPTR